MMNFPKTHEMLTRKGFKLLSTENPLEAYQVIHNSFISRFEITEDMGTPLHTYIDDNGVSVVIYDEQFYVFFANQAITQFYNLDVDLLQKVKDVGLL